MEFTGERFLPEIQGNIELEHLHRYIYASQIVDGKVVLDIASGEGYGANILSKNALRVFGVDISVEAVNHAKNKYVADNIEFIAASCTDIPLPSMSIDVVVSFETIEHHAYHEKMLQEIKRVMKPEGLLLMSSPDKQYYSDEPGFANAYHVKELYEHEFKKLIHDYFKNAAYYCQKIIYGSAIFPEIRCASTVTYTKENSGVQSRPGLAKPTFWIALASDDELPDLTVGFFEQPIEDSELHRWKDKELANAIDLLRLKDEHLAEAADLIKKLDIMLAETNSWRAFLSWLRNKKWS